MECSLVVKQNRVSAGRAESLVDHHSFVMQTVGLLDFHKEMLHIEFSLSIFFGIRSMNTEATGAIALLTGGLKLERIFS